MDGKEHSRQGPTGTCRGGGTDHAHGSIDFVGSQGRFYPYQGHLPREGFACLAVLAHLDGIAAR